jgi:SAM-dependent methyltransferase
VVSNPPYRDFAGYYDQLMGGRYVRAWWRVFRRLAAARGLHWRTAADLAGGTGEAARLLARTGADVTLVDRSAEMLARARRRVPGVRLLRQDLRALRLPAPVDLAVCAFGGLNYLSSEAQLTAVAGRVRGVLAPGGVFCLDAVTPFHLRRRYGRGQEVFSGRDYQSVWSYRWDPERRCTRIRVEGFQRSGWNTWRRHRPELHVHYAYPLSAWRRVLAAAGFARVEAFGLPLGTPPSAHDAYWLLLARPEGA